MDAVVANPAWTNQVCCECRRNDGTLVKCERCGLMLHTEANCITASAHAEICSDAASSVNLKGRIVKMNEGEGSAIDWTAVAEEVNKAVAGGQVTSEANILVLIQDAEWETTGADSVSKYEAPEDSGENTKHMGARVTSLQAIYGNVQDLCLVLVLPADGDDITQMGATVFAKPTALVEVPLPKDDEPADDGSGAKGDPKAGLCTLL